jgi:hypothetical protein
MNITTAREARSGPASYAAGMPDRALAVRASLIGGLVGGVIIWIYEALVWVGIQQPVPLAGIPRNATHLAFASRFYHLQSTAAALKKSVEAGAKSKGAVDVFKSIKCRDGSCPGGGARNGTAKAGRPGAPARREHLLRDDRTGKSIQ